MKLFFSSFCVFFLSIFLMYQFFSDNYDESADYASVEHFYDMAHTHAPLETAGEQEERIVLPVKPETKILFQYKPRSFRQQAQDTLVWPIEQALDSKIFSNQIQELVVLLYKRENETRGNMKNKVLRLYDIERLWEKETLAVFLHELAHYIDIHHFKKQDGYDLSHSFYNISWETSSTVRAGQTEKDFVSGYAATNIYEDFAESYIYFIFHNTAFLKRAEDSEILQKKYDFLATHVFLWEAFQESSFSVWEQKNYHRDSTKLDFSLKNFLDYLKKSI